MQVATSRQTKVRVDRCLDGTMLEREIRQEGEDTAMMANPAIISTFWDGIGIAVGRLSETRLQPTGAIKPSQRPQADLLPSAGR